MLHIETRPERASDVDDIRDINIEAFRDHPYSQQTEHLIVDALRDAGALAMSLVAVDDGGGIVGHIAFSAVSVGDCEPGWFLLGPIAVRPAAQGRGIGTALVETGLSALRASGARGCVLVGDPAFYSRFDFRSYPDLSYEGVPPRNVLGLPFADAAPCGRILANGAFEIEPTCDDGLTAGP